MVSGWVGRLIHAHTLTLSHKIPTPPPKKHTYHVLRKAPRGATRVPSGYVTSPTNRAAYGGNTRGPATPTPLPPSVASSCSAASGSAASVAVVLGAGAGAGAGVCARAAGASGSASSACATRSATGRDVSVVVGGSVVFVVGAVSAALMERARARSSSSVRPCVLCFWWGVVVVSYVC